MAYSDGPYKAPKTWREFLMRVAVIAVAASIVLGAIDLFETLKDSHHVAIPQVKVDRP